MRIHRIPRSTLASRDIHDFISSVWFGLGFDNAGFPCRIVFLAGLLPFIYIIANESPSSLRIVGRENLAVGVGT